MGVALIFVWRAVYFAANNLRKTLVLLTPRGVGLGWVRLGGVKPSINGSAAVVVHRLTSAAQTNLITVSGKGVPKW